jgi:hypothetical protein
MEWSLGTNLLDQVNLLRINKSLILISVVLLSNRDPGKRRTFLSQICHDGASVDSGDSRYSFTSTPFTETLNSGPMAIFLSIVGNNDTTALDIWGLKVLKKPMFITG